MQPRYVAGLLFLASSLAAAAQATCNPNALPAAAKQVEAVRHALRAAAVPTSDPAVPAPIAAQLLQLKSALADAADAAFACAAPSVADAGMKATLAEALKANRSGSVEETSEELPGNREQGAYGSDLAVEVFQLFNQPRIFEVTFRFGIECGDDNLLLVFQAPSERSGTWHEALRWGTSAYNNVGDALGDFIMLTPLTGEYKHPTWRFLVAHGHPGCAARPRPSTFSLDLLTPTADPAKPTVSWHFDHPYTEGLFAPRLATTEDTIEFRLTPIPPEPAKHPVKPTAQRAAPRQGKTSSPEVYRFHLEAGGQIVPTEAQPDQAATPNH